MINYKPFWISLVSRNDERHIYAYREIFFSFRCSCAVRIEDAPPTIVFGLPTGSAAVEPTGALSVFPGSILHLECLFARKLGNPEWTWTSTFRRYLTGKVIKSQKLLIIIAHEINSIQTFIIFLTNFIINYEAYSCKNLH